MPTKKPVVQIVISNKYYEKLKTLAEKEEKSASSQGAKIIEQYIDNYEMTNGTIDISIK